MSYNSFAYLYDALNQAADYNRLFQELSGIFRRNGIADGILADLGCGTGEMALRFAKAGYTVLAVDSSVDMLSVFQDKLSEGSPKDILLLQQDLARLDFYGTVQGAYSTFDTLNHLPQSKLEKALARISLFLEPGGLFIFDANTPYKHAGILADNEFCIEDGYGGVCIWKNTYDAAQNPPATRIDLRFTQNGEEAGTESFWEYAYPLHYWQAALKRHGFSLLEVCDGERFTALSADSPRFLFTARKQ